ncbi:MAG TPA: tail fiber domain-containing protein, partial [Parafilimonas sp.]|nr:tail fiber domain-containing protein [Parafilimonas sp.]
LLIYQTNSTPGFYYFDGSIWKPISAKGANQTLSNLTTTSVNAPLQPDSDNVRNLGSASNSWKDIYLDGSVYLGGARFLAYKTGSGANNTAVGSASLNANTTGFNNTATGGTALFLNETGNDNTASGYEALYSNITGSYNVANGTYALYASTGSYNTATGYDALGYNTTGNYNAAVGALALSKNTTGNNNVASGYNALAANTTGYGNVAVGINALKNNAIGHNMVAIGDSALFHQTGDIFYEYGNVAVGSKAMYQNSTGKQNTAIGFEALYTGDDNELNTAIGYVALHANTGGSGNTGVGAEALSSNTTGYENAALGFGALSGNQTGGYNTATGYTALYRNGGGSSNTASGFQALYSSTGDNNVAIGAGTGISATSADNNTYLGYHAGNTVTTGNSNTIIGYGADVSSGALTNATALGNLAVSGASNRVRIGNGSVSSIGGAVGWTNFSDERIKTDIKENVPGLKFINLLKPVTYHFDIDKEENITGRKSDAWDGKYDIKKIQFTGFLAQEVEKASKQVGYDFSGVDEPKNEKDLYGLRYAEFVVPLVKAVQELSKMNDEKDSKIHNLQNQLNDQQKQIDELKSMIVSNRPTANSQQSTIASASLQQNIPNPFNHTTTINYTLPPQYSLAKIIITDKSGKVLKESNLTTGGKGSLNVDASTLSSGAYQYSLYLDGKLIDTKQFVVAK